MCRTNNCIRMISNQIPSDANAAASCRDRAIRCSSPIRRHSGVSYSETSSGGQNHLPSSNGASQSSSLSGSKECLAEESSSRSATCSRSLSRPSASRSTSASVIAVPVQVVPDLHGLPAGTTYETACQQVGQYFSRDLLT